MTKQRDGDPILVNNSKVIYSLIVKQVWDKTCEKFDSNAVIILKLHMYKHKLFFETEYLCYQQTCTSMHAVS